MKFISAKHLFGILIAYVLLAGTWWSLLLYQKTKEAFKAEKTLLQEQYIAKGGSSETFETWDEYLKLKRKNDRQRTMIMSEGGVLLLVLIIGIWLVYRNFQKEAEVTRQQRNFLLSITHELKSPIASMRLALETFLKRQLNQEQISRLAGNAVLEADRLNALVENLLLAARIEGELKLVSEELDFSFWLQQFVEKAKVRYPQVHMETQIEADVVLMADPGAMTSIVQNLIENAVKYAGDSKRIDIQLSCKNNSAILKLMDTGIGISDKEKSKVFDKFYRVGNEETRETKGTGLGLYIVKMLTESQKGQISILDNQPRGTQFVLKFPLIKS